MFQELHAAVTPQGALQLEWAPTPERVDKGRHILQQEVFKRFEAGPSGALLYLGFCDNTVPLSESLSFWRNFCGLFAERLRLTPDIETLRHKVEIPLDRDELYGILENAPLTAGVEYLKIELLENIRQGLQNEFRKQIKAYKGTVADFIKMLSPQAHLVGRVYFHLVESKKASVPFAFLATYSTAVNKEGQSKHLPLKYAIEEFGEDSAKLFELLTTVQLAAKESSLIAGLLDNGELFHPIGFSAREAYDFLREIPAYEKAGILCRIPNWWKGASSSLSLRVSVGGKKPSYVGMDALVDFNPQLLLDGVPITPEEARKLLRSSEGLAFIKNKWIAVDPEKLRETLAAYERSRELIETGEFSLRDALRLQMDPGAMIKGAGADNIEVSNGEWLGSVIQKLRSPEFIDVSQPGDGFRAELRPYQQKGVNWLCFHHSLRFGVCLADDMGLGKTVQALALLHILKTRGAERASLLIVPASLLANWQDELKKFAPELRFLIAHPGANEDRGVSPLENDELDKLDLVITTYSLIQRYEWLHSHEWNYIIIDEAQAIKNPAARQTKAVKRLKANNRLAMTGTPVENSLTDLWSIFDFINPGLLGSSAEFSQFAKKLRGEPEGYARLRRLVSPYILRRLKTDRSVISDLPEKVEMKTYSSLGRKQIVLYKEMVSELIKTVEKAEGIQRKGLILSFLMKSKQLCNHPDQYTGTGDFEEKNSGKFLRLREICETIKEKREKVLVFTQFKEITGPLKSFLDFVFEKEGLVLHGSTPVSKRKALVNEFQNAAHYVPFMVLSLKAGGVGLNLTAANHVIHFDRWWNPAVENQATDRAFRIGQTKNVVVHKFLTKGTVEEKIDIMIEDKIKLATDVIQSSGESWVTEMGNKELMELFSLSL